MRIDERQVPVGSLIAPYATADAHYVDCFECAAPGPVTLQQYVRAFYTQPLFRAERLVLRVLARSPSTDTEVAALAAGDADRFAVWRVAGRTDTELFMQDRSGRTMSWLQADNGVLRFGSVVVPEKGRSGKLTLGPVFHSLLGTHKVYSRLLLAGATRRMG